MRAICAQAGLNIKQHEFDNGLDLEITSVRPENGGAYANVTVSFQLKATERWDVNGADHISYDLPVKNYNQLRQESITPQYLVLFTLPNEQDDWIKYRFEQDDHKHVVEIRHMAYYLSLKGKPKINNQKTIRVNIPVINKLTSQALMELYQSQITQTHSWITNQENNRS